MGWPRVEELPVSLWFWDTKDLEWTRVGEKTDTDFEVFFFDVRAGVYVLRSRACTAEILCGRWDESDQLRRYLILEPEGVTYWLDRIPED